MVDYNAVKNRLGIGVSRDTPFDVLKNAVVVRRNPVDKRSDFKNAISAINNIDPLTGAGVENVAFLDDIFKHAVLGHLAEVNTQANRAGLLPWQRAKIAAKTLTDVLVGDEKSAVNPLPYHFGRLFYDTLGVPIGTGNGQIPIAEAYEAYTGAGAAIYDAIERQGMNTVLP